MMILRLLLSSFASISKGKFVLLWNLSFPLKENLKEKNSLHVVSTLDLRFKNLHLVSSFIDCAKNVNIIEKYDR
jgi:hypothetical protein